jgi:hypothetical protein
VNESNESNESNETGGSSNYIMFSSPNFETIIITSFEKIRHSKEKIGRKVLKTNNKTKFL